MFYLLLCLAYILVIVLFYFLKKFNLFSNIEKAIKIITIIYMFLAFLNLFLPDGISIRAYPDQSLYENGNNLYFVIIRWLNDISLLLIPISIFYNKKYFKRIIVFGLPIIIILNILAYNTYMNFYISPLGEGIKNIRFFII